MKTPFQASAGLAACLLFSPYATALPAASTPAILKELRMQHSQHITGSFDIKLSAQTAAPGIASARLGRMTIDKQFHGELTAHSLGEMLSAAGEVKGSAGYVAIERVSGTLQGKKGSFVLMHSGSMDRGEAQLSVQVVPDSGTQELAGLTGQMGIQISNGQHFYTFDYTLP
jgi:hypothetical protein